MAQTSGDQTKDGSQPGAGTKDTPNQANSATAAPAVAATTTTTTSTATVHDPEQDKDFDPSAEALIDEIDDERTLEEEEALAGADSAAVQNEIDDLKRESEMPIEELLAFYERMRNEEAAAAGANGEEEEELEDEDMEEEEDDDEEEGEDEDEAGSDEVRKKRVDKTVSVSGNSASDQRLAHHPPAAGQPANRPTQQMQSPQQHQAQPHLSNHTHKSPSPQHHHNHHRHHQQQQHQTSDVSLNNNAQLVQQSADTVLSGRQAQIQCQDSAYAVSDNNTPTSIPPTSEDNSISHHEGQQRLPNNTDITSDHHHHHHQQQQQHSYNYPHHQPRQQPIDGANPVSSTTPRAHRHSMTEYLVDSGPAAGGIFRTLLDYDLDDSDDLDEDYSYTDDESAEDEREWRRVIHVGPEHQADVPEGLAEYENNLPPYENLDTLVWRCNPEQESDELLSYLKQASMIGKRNDISLSPASVPKISGQNLRMYRERMHDPTPASVTSLNPLEHNHENIQNNTSENPPENLQDVYMSQSRKRLRIDSELEQENAMDGIIQPLVDQQIASGIVTAVKDDNSNSVSQDNRPELSTEYYYQGEEQLLFLLLQCNHNFEEAMRRRRLDPFKYYLSEPMSLWSQEECLGFEHGLRTYGKNFRLIRDIKVPTRTRAEVVAFYYLWKKSERHDVYTNQYKLDRKRCLTHPGTTDYMDKFIEDNESALNASSSTPTPTLTPTDSSAEVHQISVIPTATNNQSISICNTSDPGLELTDCSRRPGEISIIQSARNEVNHKANSDDRGAHQGGTSLCLDGNAPL